jgi:hypothetical protein
MMELNQPKKKPRAITCTGLIYFGAQKKTRTSTPLQAPAPEAGASTNFAIWASLYYTSKLIAPKHQLRENLDTVMNVKQLLTCGDQG